MRDLVSSLLYQSRIRRQDADPKMLAAKPGDTAKVKTLVYVDETVEPASDLYGPGGPFNKLPLFYPKEAEPIEYICTSNTNKLMNHLLGSEYDNMKERQDNMLKFPDYQ